jgi:hypothetical protein
MQNHSEKRGLRGRDLAYFLQNFRPSVVVMVKIIRVYENLLEEEVLT